ncbi:hypothetical protein MASR2M8_17840 [Opitutaceae bacterium]
MRILGRLTAGRQLLQVESQVFHAFEALIPAVLRLDVHSTDTRVTLAKQVGYKMAADETTGTADNDQFILHRAK